MILNCLPIYGQNNFMEKVKELKRGKEINKKFTDTYLPEEVKANAEYSTLTSAGQIDFEQDEILLLIEENSGICSNMTIISYNVEGELIDHLQIREDCDADISLPYYDAFDYEIYSSLNLIEIEYYEERIKDTTLIDARTGYLKDFASLINNETVERKYFQYYTLNENGSFKELTVDTVKHNERLYPETSFRVLWSGDFLNKDKKELRIMRNEIFAAHGYIFNSKDLNEYFNKHDWYKPESKEVSEKLTDIEKINLQIILEREKEIR